MGDRFENNPWDLYKADRPPLKSIKISRNSSRASSTPNLERRQRFVMEDKAHQQ